MYRLATVHSVPDKQTDDSMNTNAGLPQVSKHSNIFMANYSNPIFPTNPSSKYIILYYITSGMLGLGLALRTGNSGLGLGTVDLGLGT